MYRPGFGLCAVLGNDVNVVETTVARSSCVTPTSIKVLVITHEKADLRNTDDYFAHKFFPLQVMFLIGRNQSRAHRLYPRVTLYDLWKDLIV